MKKRASGIFSPEEVHRASLDYFGGDELAASTWMSKYAVKDKEGRYRELSPADMHLRLAREFARVEKKYARVPGKKRNELSLYGQKREPLTEKTIFRLLDRFRYVIPQGSVMASLGNKYTIASLSNCVVLPEIYDSYGGIFYTDQQLAQLFKRRCGVGIDISSLRPSGMLVHNAARTTSGAVSFMERFSNTTREVAQNGRRGALMITLDVAHPDIEHFVTSKQDLEKITGANISVKVSDEFMQAVVADSDFTLRFPIDAKRPRYKRTIRARTLWDSIIRCAHHTAEPGILFWDRQHRYSTSSVYPAFRNLSTNPCSEIAMQGGDSCRLVALNLFSFVQDPFTPHASFNRQRFYEVVYEAQRLMDDLVDLELEAIGRILDKVQHDPEPAHIKQVELSTWKLLYSEGRKGRRTGLGFTGLADVLAALNMKFDSEEALAETEKIMRIKCEAEFDSSVDMAIERGKFRDFDPRIENRSEFIQMLRQEFPALYRRMMRHGRRNISLSTVAPTGTLSLLAQTSSGIEPVFMLCYKRRRKVNPSDKNARVAFTDALGDAWEEFTVYHNKLKLWMEVSGEQDIRKSPYAQATADEIDWKKRIQLQALVQRYTTHSISSTLNLPGFTSEEQVAGIYLEAWRQGLKGITVYRSGSRSGVLVSAEHAEPTSLDRICPECGDAEGMIHEEGCVKCKSCGHGVCG
ncbi:MAG: adenosylcobalamin-dependent ribonucleoside-diphosphate reductase [Bacteroidota bacterium]